MATDSNAPPPPRTRNSPLPEATRSRLSVAARVLPKDGQRQRYQRLWIEWFGTALFALVLVCGLVGTGATERFDNAVYDLGLRLQKAEARRDIVIVAVDDASINREGEWPWSRPVQARLIAAIASARPRAVGWYFLMLLPGKAAEDKATHDAISGAPTFLAVPDEDGIRRQPPPQIRAAARGLGAAEAHGDEDGIIRRTALFKDSPTGRAPRIVLQMSRLGAAQDIHRANGVASRFSKGSMLIPFVGGPGAFRRVSAVEVLKNPRSRSMLTGKFVLVGATAAGMLDNYPTPVSRGAGMPEVEVDANVLDSLLAGRSIVAASPFATVVISTALIWLMLLSLVRLGPNSSLWFAALMAVAPLILSLAGVTMFHFWVTPAPYLVTLALILPYWGWRRLNAASSYFAAELRALEGEAGPSSLQPTSRRVGGDVVLQQMTLLEEAKRRISDLRQFVDDILANFPDPVLVVDRRGAIITGNAAARAFAGLTGDQIGQGDSVLPLLSRISEAAAVWPPEVAEQGSTGPGPGGRTYELRFTATHDSAEDATGWIIHFADITALVTAMRGREEALQLLSHDMRSPQAAIIALLNHPEFLEAPQTMRKRIESQARRTLDMADAFVRLAKAEASRYAFEPIDLAFILQDATESVWSLAQSGGVKMRTESDGVELLVLADRGLMTRALVNILDNAIKFSPRGSEIVCRLQVGEMQGAPAAICEIADQAGGMDQDELNDVFTRFASGRDAVSSSPGIGLGLALVRTVVLRHNGSVICDSKRGVGTAFRITLPTIDEAEAERIELALAAA